ncbi:MAG: transposase zinc-binding domain-containing protein [Polyangiaceae bacterium]|nr:transposase zinc-binding domain-containing protein [Polyangiaceae bacterium]
MVIPPPKHVQRELQRFVRCGRLEHGFTRRRRKRGGYDLLVAFWCATRICRCCCGRRMAQAGAHLVDNVLPDPPVRQWVLTAAFPVCMLLAARDRIVETALHIALEPIREKDFAEHSYGFRSGR